MCFSSIVCKTGIRTQKCFVARTLLPFFLIHLANDGFIALNRVKSSEPFQQSTKMIAQQDVIKIWENGQVIHLFLYVFILLKCILDYYAVY